MKITQIESFSVEVPYIPAIRKYRPTEAPILIAKAYTDEGIIGYGEGGRGQNLSESTQSLIGKDPLDLIPSDMGAPLECAIYDIWGKVFGVPVYKLLGGKYRDKIPVAYWSCYMEPADTAKEAEFAAKKGYNVHKLKARPWDIIQQARLITEAAGPDYQIRVDPNFTFETMAKTIELAEGLGQYNIESFEDPINWRDNFDEYVTMKKAFDIPLCLHMGNGKDMLDAIKAEACHGFNVGGSAKNVLKLAGIAESAGMPIWIQTAGLSLGIAAAFSLHIAAAVRETPWPIDSLHFLREDDLIVESLEAIDGHIDLPETPGIGVTLDEKTVKKYRVR